MWEVTNNWSEITDNQTVWQALSSNHCSAINIQYYVYGIIDIKFTSDMAKMSSS
jgi:hypothetical protein